MGTRELLILILGLAVIAVILRGLYVALHARRSQIRLSIDNNIPQDIDLEELELAELPSGGARVVKRSLASVNQQNTLQNELDLDPQQAGEEAVPILLDTVEIKQAPEAETRAAAVNRQDQDEAQDDYSAGHDDFDDEDEYAVDEQYENSDADHDESEEDWADKTAEEAGLAPRDEYDDEGDWEVEEDDRSAAEDDPDWDRDYHEPVVGSLDQEDVPESGLDPDAALDDEFGEFSLTAGDRIGAPEGSVDDKRRGKASADRGEDVADDGSRRDSLFSRFSRKSPTGDRGVPQQDIDSQVETDDPLFSRRGEPVAQHASQPADEQQDEYTGHQTETTESDSSEIADLNQARESRRPVHSGARVRTESAAPARREVEPSEVLVVNVMSREGELFSGAALLQVMITAGLKHGDMNIFHKHLDNDVDSPVIFSVANILNPGTFDLDNMDSMATRGVSLFLAMPAVISNRDAFEEMLRIAQQIRAALDGELRDDHRSVMTAQTIEHYRQRIQDYELRKLKAAQAQS